jgi:Ni,Fe-hydrogenase I large subunit
MATYQVDPISRIEGHLGVKLTTAGAGSGATVTEADVHGNLWRGFENFLIGRAPNDAITFTQRICGVCPVPHGMASTYAVEAAIGYNDNFQTFVTGTSGKAGYGVPAKALHMRNLILGSEFLMSSLTHFYHLAAPSYVQGPAIPPWTPYFNDNFYHAALQAKGHGLNAGGTSATISQSGALPALGTNGFSKDLWSAVITQYVTALRIRRLTFEASAMFAGRAPMTSAYIAGGVGFNHETSLATRASKFREITAEIGDFVVRQYVPLVLALGALYPAYDNTAGTGVGYGAGCGNFLSWGCFPQVDGSLAAGYARGWRRLGVVNPAMFGTSGASGITVADVQSNLVEDISRSRYTSGAPGQGYTSLSGAGAVEYPGNVSRTIPLRTDTTKYSWMKAPRWNTRPMEVGPMARMYVSTLFQYGQSLASTVTAAGITDYMAYTKTAAAPYATSGLGIGLDPKMVYPDLAVACVVTDLAKVAYCVGDSPTGAIAYADAGNIAGLSGSTIAAVYNYDSAVILGGTIDLPGYIIGLKAGLSTMDRLRARALESLVLVQHMIGQAVKPTNAATGTVTFPSGGWAASLAALPTAAATYNSVATPTSQVLAKFGATEAPRGALMHFVSINNGKILKYQCVVPTTWNGSPKCGNGYRGPIEQAMIGIPFDETLTSPAYAAGTGNTISGAMGGVEALRVAQSFDPCIACAVH